MVWLRNRKTDGWFEIPDEEYYGYKEKQIAENAKQAEQKNVPETPKYADNTNYDKWVRENLPTLKAEYKRRGDLDTKEEWRNYRFEKESQNVHEMNINDAIKATEDAITVSRIEGWFRGADSSYKPVIIDSMLGHEGVYNAALNIGYYNYRYKFERYSDFYGKWIPHEGVDQSKKLSFKEWLDTPITMYRGSIEDKKFVKDDVFVSYTPDRSVAEKFGNYDGGKIDSIQITPRETWGSVMPTGEQEFMVPRTWLKKRGKG